MTGKTKAKLTGIGVVLIVLAIVLNPNCSLDSYNVRVVDKQVKRLDSGREVFMIFTMRDNGKERVFIDADTKLFMKFNSADLYAKMEMGKWYRVRTVGWRINIISRFENILKADPLPGPPPGAKPD
jgi:hypothetical protein